MRMIFAAAALALAACGPTGAVNSTPGPIASAVTSIDDVGDTVVLNGTRSLILADNAYQGAVAALLPLVKAGVFSQAQLDRIQQLSDRAFAALEAGRKGQATARRAAEVFDIVTELHTLKGQNR